MSHGAQGELHAGLRIRTKPRPNTRKETVMKMGCRRWNWPRRIENRYRAGSAEPTGRLGVATYRCKHANRRGFGRDFGMGRRGGRCVELAIVEADGDMALTHLHLRNSTRDASQARSRTNTDDRLPLDALGRIEGGNGVVEVRDVADVRAQASVPHSLDDLTQLGAVGHDNEVDR